MKVEILEVVGRSGYETRELTIIGFCCWGYYN